MNSMMTKLHTLWQEGLKWFSNIHVAMLLQLGSGFKKMNRLEDCSHSIIHQEAANPHLVMLTDLRLHWEMNAPNRQQEGSLWQSAAFFPVQPMHQSSRDENEQETSFEQSQIESFRSIFPVEMYLDRVVWMDRVTWSHMLRTTRDVRCHSASASWRMLSPRSESFPVEQECQRVTYLGWASFRRSGVKEKATGIK